MAGTILRPQIRPSPSRSASLYSGVSSKYRFSFPGGANQQQILRQVLLHRVGRFVAIVRIASGGTLDHVRQLARDVGGDPRRPAVAPDTRARVGLEDVLAANLSRAKEGLRALEEYGKPLDAEAAVALSKLRYAVYDLEPLLLAGPGSLEDRRVKLFLKARAREGTARILTKKPVFTKAGWEIV